MKTTAERAIAHYNTSRAKLRDVQQMFGGRLVKEPARHIEEMKFSDGSMARFDLLDEIGEVIE